LLRVFALMPFPKEKESDEVWTKGIRMCVAGRRSLSSRFVVRRADDRRGPGKIPEDVRTEIREAHVVIADITEANPNVMFELARIIHERQRGRESKRSEALRLPLSWCADGAAAPSPSERGVRAAVRLRPPVTTRRQASPA